MQVSLTSSPGLHHCPTFDCLQYAKIGGEGGREDLGLPTVQLLGVLTRECIC